MNQQNHQLRLGDLPIPVLLMIASYVGFNHIPTLLSMSLLSSLFLLLSRDPSIWVPLLEADCPQGGGDALLTQHVDTPAWRLYLTHLPRPTQHYTTHRLMTYLLGSHGDSTPEFHRSELCRHLRAGVTPTWVPQHVASVLPACKLLLGQWCVPSDYLVSHEGRSQGGWFMDGSLLHWAAQVGDVDALLYLHSHGAHLDTRGGVSHRSPLHHAACGGRPAAIRLLLALGRGDVDAKDQIGVTPLLLACQRGHVDSVRVLVEEAGANLLESDNRQRSALFLAAHAGELEVVEYLLGTGRVKASAPATDAGLTPLHAACKAGNVPIARALLAHGADVSALSAEKASPLSIACWNGNLELVQLLLDAGARWSAEAGGTSPLHWAAGHANTAVIRVLLATGDDVNTRDASGRTPLIWAAERADEQVVQELLDLGADVLAADENGATALHLASEASLPEMVGLLLRAGKEKGLVNARDGVGRSALHRAAKDGHIEVLLMLLAAGADVNLSDLRGWTPLRVATDSGYMECEEILMRRGGRLSGGSRCCVM